MTKYLISSLPLKYVVGLCGLCIILCVGTAYALIPHSTFEAEDGTSLVNSTVVDDPQAVQGQALEFESAATCPAGQTGTPPNCTTPPSTAFCDTFPQLPSARPDATNTGVPSGTVLTPSGSITVNTPGTIIDAKDITGNVYIYANNTTIKNSRIRQSGGSAAKGVYVDYSVTGTKILYSEIYTTNGGYIGIQAPNTTICGSKLWGWENAMTIEGGMMVQANFIERLKGGQAGPHYDGIEVYGGGAPTKIWGNHIKNTDQNGNWLGDTGAINITAWYENINDVELNGNILGGGSYSLYVAEQGGFQVTNVKITNNRWYRNSAQYGTHVIYDDTSVTTWSGNVFDDNGQIINK